MIRGAHAFCVLVKAFCLATKGDLRDRMQPGDSTDFRFVAAECGDQHAASARSPVNLRID
jgi:hypothetical protein